LGIILDRGRHNTIRHWTSVLEAIEKKVNSEP
jgi:hypothetical protein